MNRKVSFRNIIKIILEYVDGGKLVIWKFVLTIVIETAFVITAPLITRRITNSYADNNVGDYNSTIVLILMLAGCYILGAVMRFVNLRTANSVAGIVVRNMRKACRDKINSLPLSYLDSHATGDILSRVTSDLSTVYDSLQSSVISVVAAVATVSSMMVIMLVVRWQTGLVFAVLIPVIYLCVMQIAKKTRKRFWSQRKLLGQLNGYINDICENHLLVESFDYADRAQSEFDELNDAYKKKYISGNFMSGFILPINSLVNNLAYVVVCVIGAVLMAEGIMDLGTLQVFLFYTSMIEAPNRALAFNLVSLQNGMSAVERIVEFLDDNNDLKEEIVTEQLHSDTSLEGNVDFSNVQFGYTPENMLMKNVDFRVRAGMKVAIVGPSGAGKTTLVNLLMRFYEINAGAIKVDGVDISSVSRGNLRQCFGMVLQDPWIFDGTIAENIAYGKEGTSIEEIKRVAAATGCDLFIDRLPEGYNTVISGEESVLSDGQMQLLSIARVALANPGIMILDEATSQVDTQTESLIMSAIEKLMIGRTSFIIAHRLYTIQNADLILYMENGDILESGTHDELLRLNGRYAEMFRLGFDD